MFAELAEAVRRDLHWIIIACALVWAGISYAATRQPVRYGEALEPLYAEAGGVVIVPLRYTVLRDECRPDVSEWEIHIESPRDLPTMRWHVLATNYMPHWPTAVRKREAGVGLRVDVHVEIPSLIAPGEWVLYGTGMQICTDALGLAHRVRNRTPDYPLVITRGESER